MSPDDATVLARRTVAAVSERLSSGKCFRIRLYTSSASCKCLRLRQPDNKATATIKNTSDVFQLEDEQTHYTWTDKVASVARIDRSFLLLRRPNQLDSNSPPATETHTLRSNFAYRSFLADHGRADLWRCLWDLSKDAMSVFDQPRMRAGVQNTYVCPFIDKIFRCPMKEIESLLSSSIETIGVDYVEKASISGSSE